MADMIEGWVLQTVLFFYLGILGWGCFIVQHSLKSAILGSGIVVFAPVMYGLWYYPVAGFLVGSFVPLAFMSLLALRNLYLRRDPLPR
jgi:hypothetical protein